MAVETDQRKDFIDFTTTQSKLEVLDDVERKIVHSLALSGNFCNSYSSSSINWHFLLQNKTIRA